MRGGGGGGVANLFIILYCKIITFLKAPPPAFLLMGSNTKI